MAGYAFPKPWPPTAVLNRLPHISAPANPVGAPCFSRGSWTLVQRNCGSSLGMGLSPGFSGPALKRMVKVRLFIATLKRCFPLLKQRAPTPPLGLRQSIPRIVHSHIPQIAFRVAASESLAAIALFFQVQDHLGTGSLGLSVRSIAIAHHE
jgi:hypothetical protein